MVGHKPTDNQEVPLCMVGKGQLVDTAGLARAKIHLMIDEWLDDVVENDLRTYLEMSFAKNFILPGTCDEVRCAVLKHTKTDPSLDGNHRHQ